VNSTPATGARIITFGGHTPRIAPDAFIADSAVLIGDVEIGPGASIWFGAVLRGDCGPIRVGANSNIQDGCVLHTDPGFDLVIGANVSVGHRAIVHGATVGHGALIGMGAVLLNGSVVGAGSLIAAGAVVREGADIAARSLAGGVPARVIRELDEDGVERVRRNSENYVALSRQYRGQ
jgi:carbonic anhydrase/acetyltransferase-like protein (isoleucine patch superfamily)